MNKKWFVLSVALLAVFGLVLTGCPEGKIPEFNTYDLLMTGNGYGDGYQGKLILPVLQGLSSGDTVDLDLVYVVQGRAIEGKIQVKINGDNSGWENCNGDDDFISDADPAEGQTVTRFHTINVTANTTGEVALVIQTTDEDSLEHNHTKPNITLHFTKAIITVNSGTPFDLLN